VTSGPPEVSITCFFAAGTQRADSGFLVSKTYQQNKYNVTMLGFGFRVSPRALSLLLSSLELSDTQVDEHQLRARLGTAAHFCKVVVLSPGASAEGAGGVAASFLLFAAGMYRAMHLRRYITLNAGHVRPLSPQQKGSGHPTWGCIPRGEGFHQERPREAWAWRRVSCFLRRGGRIGTCTSGARPRGR